MILKRIKEAERLYRVSNDAAHAMWVGLMHAQDEEVIATDFEGSEKLDEITRLVDLVRDKYTRLSGAQDALHSVAIAS